MLDLRYEGEGIDYNRKRMDDLQGYSNFVDDRVPLDDVLSSGNRNLADFWLAEQHACQSTL